MPRPPRRGRELPQRRRSPRVLSREIILDAALAILDEQGLDAVTMRAVAERLDTGPASLYAHVADKDEMINALLDRVISEIELPSRVDARRWQKQLKQLCHAIRDAFAEHRDIARATMGTVPTGERAMELVELMIAAMLAGGVSERNAALAVDLLTLYVSAVAFEESLEENKFADSQRYHDELRAYFAALPADRFPHLQAMAFALTVHEGDERFDFGLDMLIGGLAATVRR